VLQKGLVCSKYFQGDGSPIAKEKDEKKYSIAWLHHKAHNKHHWDYWVDFCDGELVMVPMPDRYIKEMFCDMIGASKAYTGKKFSKREPLDYFLTHKDAWKMHEGSKEKLQEMLTEYAAGEP
jgi:hypothetical protein